MNAIRVVFVILAAFGFLMLLIVVTIRKKKENEASILLRILTNYIQLIGAALSFNLNFPTSLLNVFGPIDTVGSASDTFLSIDCFIEDVEMRGFAPTNELFKVFLSMILPLVLISVVSAIFGVLYLINKNKFGDIKRYLVISILCILFLLHTTLTKTSLAVFECLKVNDNSYKMRMNMDYE